MIDYFALALGHGLMAIALLRLVLQLKPCMGCCGWCCCC